MEWSLQAVGRLGHHCDPEPEPMLSQAGLSRGAARTPGAPLLPGTRSVLEAGHFKLELLIWLIDLQYHAAQVILCHHTTALVEALEGSNSDRPRAEEAKGGPGQPSIRSSMASLEGVHGH